MDLIFRIFYYSGSALAKQRLNETQSLSLENYYCFQIHNVGLKIIVIVTKYSWKLHNLFYIIVRKQSLRGGSQCQNPKQELRQNPDLRKN